MNQMTKLGFTYNKHQDNQNIAEAFQLILENVEEKMLNSQQRT